MMDGRVNSLSWEIGNTEWQAEKWKSDKQQAGFLSRERRMKFTARQGISGWEKKMKNCTFWLKTIYWSPDFAAAFWNACKISLFRKGITYVAFTLWTHFQAHSQPRHIANRLDKYDLGTNGKQTNSRTEKKSKKQPYKNGLVNKLLTNMLVVNLPATVVHQLVLYQ